MARNINKIILAVFVSAFLIVIIPFVQLLKAGKYLEKTYKIVQVTQPKEISKKRKKPVKKIKKIHFKSHIRKRFNQSMGRFALDLSVSAQAVDNAVAIIAQKSGIYKTWEVDVKPQEKRIAVPAYPKEAQEKEIEGRVVVEIIINEKGYVSSVHILEETPTGLRFGQSATEAVRKWEFEPALIQGIPVKYTFRRQIDFKLE